MKRSCETLSNHQNELNLGKESGTAKQLDCHSSTEEFVSDAVESGKDEMQFLCLPPEILILVLWRVSIKTLFVLKCVCRFFNQSISSPDFTGAHLKLSSNDVSSSHNKVIVKSVGSYSKLKESSVESLLCHNSSTHMVDLDYPEKESQKYVGLVGSCNGLVFIIVGKHIIWNPAINKATKLPHVRELAYLRKEDVDNSMYFCGFHYDVQNDDYKVVALIAEREFGSKSKKTVRYVTNVFSLNRKSWTRLPDFTYGELKKSFAKFASGKLHWLTTHGKIVSLDIEKEVFGTVEQPDYEKGYRDAKLSVLEGSICVSCEYLSRVDVWVMKEYGNKESWTKMFEYYGVCGSPNILLPNGDLVLDSGPLVIYDPKNSSFRSIAGRYFFDPLR